MKRTQDVVNIRSQVRSGDCEPRYHTLLRRLSRQPEGLGRADSCAYLRPAREWKTGFRGLSEDLEIISKPSLSAAQPLLPLVLQSRFNRCPRESPRATRDRDARGRAVVDHVHSSRTDHADKLSGTEPAVKDAGDAPANISRGWGLGLDSDN
jgi:hypothetical protein